MILIELLRQALNMDCTAKPGNVSDITPEATNYKPIQMDNILTAISSGTPGLSVTIAAADLRAVVAELYKTEAARTAAAIAANKEQPTLTRLEVSRALNVSLATLWRWAKDGYLTPVKIGTKCLYRQTDIDTLLSSNKNHCLTKGGAV